MRGFCSISSAQAGHPLSAMISLTTTVSGCADPRPERVCSPAVEP